MASRAHGRGHNHHANMGSGSRTPIGSPTRDNHRQGIAGNSHVISPASKASAPTWKLSPRDKQQGLLILKDKISVMTAEMGRYANFLHTREKFVPEPNTEPDLDNLNELQKAVAVAKFTDSEKARDKEMREMELKSAKYYQQVWSTLLTSESQELVKREANQKGLNWSEVEQDRDLILLYTLIHDSHSTGTSQIADLQCAEALGGLYKVQPPTRSLAEHFELFMNQIKVAQEALNGYDYQLETFSDESIAWWVSKPGKTLDDCATDLVEDDETVWETIPKDVLTSDPLYGDRAAFLQVRKQSYPVVSMTPVPESLLAAIYFNSLNNTRFGEWKANTIALSSTAGADLFPKTVQKVQTLAAQFESSKLQSSSSFQQKQGNNGQNQHVHANAAYHHQGKRGAPGQGGGQSKKFAGSKQCEICKNNNKNYTSHSTEECRSKAAKEQNATAHVATNQGSGNDTHGGKKLFFGSQDK